MAAPERRWNGSVTVSPLLSIVYLIRLHRVRQVEWVVSGLVGLHQCGQHIEPVAPGCAGLGIHQGFDFLEGGLIVGFRLDRLDDHRHRSSDCLYVDPIILGMGADEKNIHYTVACS